MYKLGPSFFFFSFTDDLAVFFYFFERKKYQLFCERYSACDNTDIPFSVNVGRDMKISEFLKVRKF